MKLYHGSYTKIKEVDFSKCERYIEKLMLDFQIDEMQATDLFYSSKIFIQLEDETTELYLKPWQEIYEMLKKEKLNSN